MDCQSATEIVSAEIDGYAAEPQLAALAAHMNSCAGCRRRRAELRAIRDGVAAHAPRSRAPAALRARIVADIRAPDRAGRPAVAKWPALAAAILLSALVSGAAVTALQTTGGRTDRFVDAAIDGHVRGLNVGPLTQVASSDRHTVKPWFDGKVAFAPSVVDLAESGFPLIGGRLDYLTRQPVAALVYRARAHTISLFVAEAGSALPPVDNATRAGFAAVGWRAGGLAFVAVSDIALGELEEFGAAFRAAELAAR